jgi:hypothetical protein
MGYGNGHDDCKCHSHCSIFGIFLGLLTSVIWVLLATLGVISDLFGLLDLGSLGSILNILIAVIGFLGFLLFGICIFKKVGRCCL